MAKGSFLAFNKEILLGEVGAIICAPTVAYLVSLATSANNIISASAVGGAVFGAVTFWLTTRVYDQSRKKKYSARALANDLAYFTPAALVLTLLLYYPTLYYLSGRLLDTENGVVSSVFAAQLAAFGIFLIAINIYRKLLSKFFGKAL